MSARRQLPDPFWGRGVSPGDDLTEAELCEMMQIKPRTLRGMELGRLAHFSRQEVNGWLQRNSRTRPLRSQPKLDMQTIYVVKRDGQCKIGITTQLAERLAALRTAGGADLELVASFPGTVRDETAAHRRWADLRTVGEWFRATAELLQWARERHIA